MTLQRSASRTLLALVAAGVVVLLAACGSGESGDERTNAATGSPTATSGGIVAACEQKEDFTYQGQDGKTALELLMDHDKTAKVSGEGQSAFVTHICGYAPKESDNEFWALYVDGKKAQVGAGSLETETGQKITWRLEAY